MKTVSQKVLEFATPIVEKLGYELVDVEYGKTPYGEFALTVLISNSTPITLNDCERVSKALDAPLDELNPTNDVPYNFNVSSVGLDRPLVSQRDFERCKNKEIEVKFYTLQQNGQKSVVGTIANAYADYFELKASEQILKIKYKDIAKAVQTIKF